VCIAVYYVLRKPLLLELKVFELRSARVMIIYISKITNSVEVY